MPANASSRERRKAVRYVVVCPVHLSSAERKNRLGITRDLSRCGTLVLSNSRFEVGEMLQVAIYGDTATDAPTHVMDGKVVRIETLEPGLMWHHALAVDFSRPLSTDEEEVLVEQPRESVKP